MFKKCSWLESAPKMEYGKIKKLWYEKDGHAGSIPRGGSDAETGDNKTGLMAYSGVYDYPMRPWS